MKKTKVGVFLAALLASSLAWSGATQPAPVQIVFDEFGGGNASGDLLSARNSKNDEEFIGCGIRYIETGNGDPAIPSEEAFALGFCQAALEEDETVVCFTQNKALIEGMMMTSDSNFITFSWTQNEFGDLDCTRIGSSNQSLYLPKG